MFNRLIIWSLCFFLVGCKDSLYQEAMISQTVAKADYSFNGTVELGTPLSGTTITAHQFKNLVRGEKITEVVSGSDGSFNLNLATDYDGPILLVATGGLYRDLITGEMVALKPGQELQSAITHIKMPEKTNINAWTTLATARVLADRGFWDRSIAELKDMDRIDADFAHMSYFLTGKSTSFVNIRRQEFFNIEKDTINLDQANANLHLAHGGLAKIARNFSLRLAEKGLTVSVVDLILALSNDLSDRIFDGRNAHAAIIKVGNDDHIKLDSYTMRKDLAEAIKLYAQHLQELGRFSPELKHDLERPGCLVDSLAQGNQPELFPEIDKPRAIDKAPIIQGALDGVVQKPYLEETTPYRVNFIGAQSNPSYHVESIGESKVIDWRSVPMIYRWSDTTNDGADAPYYFVKVFDDIEVGDLRYAIDTKCAPLRDANTVASKRESTYAIPLSQKSAGKYCLSIWAIDNMGNASNHKVEYHWKVIVPPLSIDVNPSRYNAHLRSDDAVSVPSYDVLFGDLLLKGIILGHAIMYNNNSYEVVAKLKLNKPMVLQLNERYFAIQSDKINIEYFSYNLAKNEIGMAIDDQESAISLQSHEAVLAKFKLVDNVLVNPGWQWKEMKLDFAKKGREHNAMVDGLKLIMQVPAMSSDFNEYEVAWGNSHVVRTRSDLNR